MLSYVWSEQFIKIDLSLVTSSHFKSLQSLTIIKYYKYLKLSWESKNNMNKKVKIDGETYIEIHKEKQKQRHKFINNRN